MRRGAATALTAAAPRRQAAARYAARGCAAAAATAMARPPGRAAQAAGKMPSYSEWAQRMPATSHAGDGARPLARYSATDSRRVVSSEQMALLSEEAELQALLRDMDAKVELHRDSAGSGTELDQLVLGRSQLAERLQDVITRKEGLVGRQHKGAGSLSTESKCERPCIPT